MNPSIRLGTISGIRVGLHWSVAAIAGLLVFSLAQTFLPALAPGLAQSVYVVVAIATSVLFLASIVAHELGHSIVAQRNGIRVRQITLFALGGVAQLESEPKSAGVAARVALAGPAVSVVIGLGGLVLGYTGSDLGLPLVISGAFRWLGVINIGLGVLNMIPALPLDGGRVLQSALWARSGDQLTSTIAAAKLGKIIGGAIMLYGVWQFFGGAGTALWTAVIGWFILSTATREQAVARALLHQRRLQEQAWPPPQGMPFGHQLFVHPPAGGRSSEPRQSASAGRGTGFPPPAREVIDVTGRPSGDDR